MSRSGRAATSSTAATDHRRSRRIDLAAAWRIGALALLAATAVLHAPGLVRHRGPWWTVLTSVTELWLLVGLVAWPLGRLPVRRVARAIGPVRTAALAVSALLLLAGQHVRDVDVWPFTRWDMYTVPVSGQLYVELEAFRGTTSLGPVPFDQVLPMVSPRPFMGPLFDLGQRAAEGDDEAFELLEQTVGTLVARIDGFDADRVEVRRCLVRAPTAAVPATCEPLASLTVGNAP